MASAFFFGMLLSGKLPIAHRSERLDAVTAVDRERRKPVHSIDAGGELRETYCVFNSNGLLRIFSGGFATR